MNKQYIVYHYFTNPNRYGAFTGLVNSLDEANEWVGNFIKERKVKDIGNFVAVNFWWGYSDFYEDEVRFGYNEV